MDKLDEVLTKIKLETVTVQDFNDLIIESMPESIRKRVQRRLRPDNHRADNATGNNRTKPMANLADRVQPKRKPRHQQSHGQSKAAHRRSERTQEQNDAN
jgi:hypothetical protein